MFHSSKFQKVGLFMCVISIFICLAIFFDLLFISYDRGESSSVYRKSNFWYLYSNHSLYFFPLKLTKYILVISSILTGFGTGFMNQKITENAKKINYTIHLQISQRIKIPLTYHIRNYKIDVVRFIFNLIIFLIIAIYLLKKSIAMIDFDQSNFRSELLLYSFSFFYLIIPLSGINYALKKLLIFDSVEEGAINLLFLIIIGWFYYININSLLTSRGII